MSLVFQKKIIFILINFCLVFLGGAVCDKCDCSAKDSHNIEKIEAGFEINRTVSGLHDLYESLPKRDGAIVRGTGASKIILIYIYYFTVIMLN